MYLLLREEKVKYWALGLFALCFAMSSALWLGQDASWDLRNYHYYNPYAWLEKRAAIDLVPAQLQSFLHPFADIPHFLMVKAGYPSWMIGCALALPVAASLLLLGLLSNVFLGNSNRLHVLLTVLLIAGTGASGFPVIGSTMSEWHITALFIAALWLSFKSNAPLSSSASFFIGCIGGLAVGFKLTGSIYAIALGAMFMSMNSSIRQRIQQTVFLVIGGCIGFIIVFAPWGLELWTRYKNPIFPFFNQWFKSPWAEFSSYAGTPYALQSIWEMLTLPWRLMYSQSLLVAEFRLQDWRLGIGFPALILLAFGPLQPLQARQNFWRPLLVFCTVSYVIWAALYGIYRYIGVLEVLMPLAIVAATVSMFKKKWTWLAVGLTATIVMTPTVWPFWGRLPHGQPVVIAQFPKLPTDSMVVLATLEPLGYLVPSLPTAVPTVSLINNFMRADGVGSQLESLAVKKVTEHQGPLWLITQEGFEAETYYDGKPINAMLRALGLEVQHKNCLPVEVRFNSKIELCPLLR